MRIRLKKMDGGLLGITLVLSFVGLVIISSASTVLSYQRFGYNTYYLARQAIAVGIGIVSMFIISRIDYRWFKKYSPLILLGSLVLLAAVLVPQIGVRVGGARRWIDLGFFFLQPSEVAKLAIILYLAAWFEAREDYLDSFFVSLAGPLGITTLAAGLVIAEPDFGSMTAFLLIVAAVIFAAGVRIRHLLAVAGVGSLLAWIAVQAAPYRMERIATFFNHTRDPLGAGYQINQALLAVGSGGLWGLGFGESRQKFNFLPEPIGDSIFAIMAEELGFVRVSVVLVLYALFAYFGFRVARNAPDSFGRLVAVGVTMWVILQASVNIGAMLKIFPLTGIPLPFIGNGGSSVIMLLTGIGIMLNISRHS